MKKLRVSSNKDKNNYRKDAFNAIDVVINDNLFVFNYFIF